MPRFVAFLRGINVGGRRVTGEQLRAPLEAAGFDRVATFLASGNVIFDAGDELDAAALQDLVAEQLESALGFEVLTFLRTAAETTRIAAHQPFPEEVVRASSGKLQVAMLALDPPDGVRDEVQARQTPDDRLVIDRRELYWLPSGGVSESDLDLAAIERALGPLTMRTKHTVERIAAKYLTG